MSLPEAPTPSQLGFILKTASAGIYHTLVQTGDHLLLSFDQNNGVAGANGIVIGGRSQTAGLRIGTTSSAFNGDLTINGGLTGSEVYTNGWFRVNTSGGLYWQAYGRGIYSADSAGASYGNVSVYGTGINTWNGYDINGRYTFMANGDTVGVHDRNNSWVWRNVNTVMYINKTLVLERVAQNSDYYSQVAVLNGSTLQKSQCMMREIYFSNNVAWSGGINITYAFYHYNTISPVQIYGKCSGYYSGSGMMQTTIRLYSQSTGNYYSYPLNSFVNVGGNHFTVPLNVISNGLPTGWFDVYVYSTSGWITDGNDQLTVCVQILPVRDF